MKMDGQSPNTSGNGLDDDRHDPGSVRAFCILCERVAWLCRVGRAVHCHEYTAVRLRLQIETLLGRTVIVSHLDQRLHLVQSSSSFINSSLAHVHLRSLGRYTNFVQKERL